MNISNELNANNLSLKELNFIAILNTIDKTKLQELIQKSDMKKVLSSVYHCECECGEIMGFHKKCGRCYKIACRGFISQNDRFVCTDCVKDVKFCISGSQISFRWNGITYKMKIDTTHLSYEQIKGFLNDKK